MHIWNSTGFHGWHWLKQNNEGQRILFRPLKLEVNCHSPNLHVQYSSFCIHVRAFFFCLFLIWKANICGIFILHIANAFCSRLFMQQILYYYIMWLLFFSVIIGTCYMFSAEGLQMKISCLSNKEYLHLCISYWYSMVCAYIVGARCLRIKIGHLVWHMKPDYTVRAINTAL